MRAAAVQWDLSSMELDELLTEKTIFFIAKVSVRVERLHIFRLNLYHVSSRRVGTSGQQRGNISGPAYFS